MKKHKGILILVIIILTLTIGFALLSTTLNITGVAGIHANTWDIHWENVENEAGVEPISPATINPDDNKEVNFEANFTIPGDYYEFNVDAVNKGTIDGMLKEIKLTINGDSIEEIDDYLEYEVTYADGTEPQENDLLAVGKQITYKVKLQYKRTITNAQLKDLPDEGEPFEGKAEVIYIQANSNAVDKGNTVVYVPKPVSFSTDPWDTIAKYGNEAATQSTVNNQWKCGPYKVGDTKTIQMDLDGDGTEEDYTLRIANCSTPTECVNGTVSPTACGFVVEFQKVIAMHRMNKYVNGNSDLGDGNTGAWEYSDLRAYLNGTLYAFDSIDYTTTGVIAKLPSELRSHLALTKVISGRGTHESANIITYDKMWVPAFREVYGSGVRYHSDYDQTRQLDYYNKQGVKINRATYSFKAPQAGGANVGWWTRSANYYTDPYFYAVSTSSFNVDSPYSPAVNNELGVSPLFKLQ